MAAFLHYQQRENLRSIRRPTGLCLLSVWYFFGRKLWTAIFQPQPVCNLLGVEPDGASDSKTRQLTSRCHSINVLVIHAQKLGEFGDLHSSMT